MEELVDLVVWYQAQSGAGGREGEGSRGKEMVVTMDADLVKGNVGEEEEQWLEGSQFSNRMIDNCVVVFKIDSTDETFPASSRGNQRGSSGHMSSKGIWSSLNQAGRISSVSVASPSKLVTSKTCTFMILLISMILNTR